MQHWLKRPLSPGSRSQTSLREALWCDCSAGKPVESRRARRLVPWRGSGTGSWPSWAWGNTDTAWGMQKPRPASPPPATESATATNHLRTQREMIDVIKNLYVVWKILRCVSENEWQRRTERPVSAFSSVQAAAVVILFHTAALSAITLWASCLIQTKINHPFPPDHFTQASEMYLHNSRFEQLKNQHKYINLKNKQTQDAESQLYIHLFIQFPGYLNQQLVYTQRWIAAEGMQGLQPATLDQFPFSSVIQKLFRQSSDNSCCRRNQGEKSTCIK